jgi:hypothetical protein
MHPNAINAKIAAQLTAVEARLDARLDDIGSKLDLILEAAGLSPRAPGPSPGAVEVLDEAGRPIPAAVRGKALAAGTATTDTERPL